MGVSSVLDSGRARCPPHKNYIQLPRSQPEAGNAALGGSALRAAEPLQGHFLLGSGNEIKDRVLA